MPSKKKPQPKSPDEQLLDARVPGWRDMDTRAFRKALAGVNPARHRETRAAWDRVQRVIPAEPSPDEGASVG